MKPYYQDDSVTIYHGDCREILSTIEADVLVTDPPYGVSYVSNKPKAGPTLAIAGDTTLDLRDWLLDWWGDRPAAVFGTWRAQRPDCRALLVWNKTGMGNGMGDLSLPWGLTHEEIYIRGAGWSGPRKGSVLTYDGYAAGAAARPDHPTPKPVALMAELLRCAPEGVVLDPFLGSGSTLRAAKDLGRRAIGIEVEERYCQMAAERMGQEVLDLGSAA